MNKNMDVVPTYPKYPTNSFESEPYEKMLSKTLETPVINEPTQHVLSTPPVYENAAPPPPPSAVSIFSLSYIEYLGMIGICVFIIFMVTELQNEYEDRKQSYLIKTNATPPTFAEMFENMKNNFITNITSFFNNSIEYVKTKIHEMKYNINKWKVKTHLENKTLKTIDISYYKDKYK